MNLVYRPIDTWPGQLTADRKPSPFDADWRTTMELLDREVHFLQGSSAHERRTLHAGAVLQLAVPEGAIRQDGGLMSGRKPPEHPGVILNVETDAGPLRFSCDRFDRASWKRSSQEGWRQNVRAIALGLEALRKVERYGLGTGREQYAGFQALPPATPMGAGAEVKLTLDEARRVLTDISGHPFGGPLDVNEVQVVYRDVVKKHHPDVGGDPAAFRLITAARDVLVEAAS